MSNPVHIDAPEGVPFIEIRREFDAPVAAVLHAHRDPDLVRQWLGPDGYEMAVDTWDFRSGGSYAYVHTNPAGERFGFRGSFHTVRDDFLVQTFEFDGWPDVVSVETLTLTALDDGRCALTIRATYPSLEARDGMVASGMEGGITQGYARLDALL